MRKSTLKAIKSYALRDFPNEACGFIIGRDGREKVYPVRNVHPNPREHFQIHPESYLEAQREGEIIACYHSHPASPAAPSPIDRAACDRTALPWYVYSVPEDALASCLPGGVAPLKGRSFIWGVYDCWTLVYDYYREVLKIALPEWEPYEQDFWKHGRNYYMERYQGFGFVPVQDLRPHDVALMQLGVEIPIHAGVYQQNGTILHHVPGRLSGAAVYGDYLRSMTTLTLRHKELL